MLRAFVVMTALFLAALAVALAVGLAVWLVLRIFHVERKDENGDNS